MKENRPIRRFYVAGPIVAGPMRLEGAEAHHLASVLRIGVGASVTLFDGNGLRAQATVTECATGLVQLRIAAPERESDSSPAIILASAVPKGDRFGWMIEKATELGVARFVPLITRRSVVVPGEGKIEKMRRTIVEASKQCGRATLMELSAPVAWPDFATTLLGPMSGWVAHPAGENVAPDDALSREQFVAAVGPEGGFTEDEIELAVAAGARPVSLGRRILRIETAAVALAALLTCQLPGSARDSHSPRVS